MWSIQENTFGVFGIKDIIRKPAGLNTLPLYLKNLDYPINMKVEDLEVGKTYNVDVGFGFYKKMEYLIHTPHNIGGIYHFKVLEHFMDSNNENWEIGDTWNSYIQNIEPTEKVLDCNDRKQIMYDLGQIWNKYLYLTTYQSSMAISGNEPYSNCIAVTKINEGINEEDQKAFLFHIHALQRIVANQELQIRYPEFYK